MSDTESTGPTSGRRSWLDRLGITTNRALGEQVERMREQMEAMREAQRSLQTRLIDADAAAEKLRTDCEDLKCDLEWQAMTSGLHRGMLQVAAAKMQLAIAEHSNDMSPAAVCDLQGVACQINRQLTHRDTGVGAFNPDLAMSQPWWRHEELHNLQADAEHARARVRALQQERQTPAADRAPNANPGREITKDAADRQGPDAGHANNGPWIRDTSQHGLRGEGNPSPSQSVTPHVERDGGEEHYRDMTR